MRKILSSQTPEKGYITIVELSLPPSLSTHAATDASIIGLFKQKQYIKEYATKSKKETYDEKRGSKRICQPTKETREKKYKNKTKQNKKNHNKQTNKNKILECQKEKGKKRPYDQ